MSIRHLALFRENARPFAKAFVSDPMPWSERPNWTLNTV